MTERALVINTAAALNLKSLSNFTIVSAAGGDAGLRQGVLLPINGLDIRQSAQVQSHTKGTATGYDVNLTAGYDVGDTDIVVNGSNSGTILTGDVVTWAGDANKYLVYSATASGAATGNITLNKPGLMATLADTVEGTTGESYTANMCFHKSAIQLVTRVPAVPSVGDSAFDSTIITDPVTGLSFEVRGYLQYRRVKYEVGLAWGCAMVKPEWAAVLLG